MRGTVRGDERDERRTHLGEADGVRALTEALTADVEAVLADQTSLVLADAAAGARGGRERVSFEVPVATRPAACSCARSSRPTRPSLGHEQRAFLLRSPTGAGRRPVRAERSRGPSVPAAVSTGRVRPTAFSASHVLAAASTSRDEVDVPAARALAVLARAAGERRASQRVRPLPPLLLALFPRNSSYCEFQMALWVMAMKRRELKRR